VIAVRAVRHVGRIKFPERGGVAVAEEHVVPHAVHVEPARFAEEEQALGGAVVLVDVVKIDGSSRAGGAEHARVIHRRRAIAAEDEARRIADAADARRCRALH